MSTGCIIAKILRTQGIILKLGFPRSSQSSAFLNPTKAWTRTFKLSRVNGTMAYIVLHETGNQVGYFIGTSHLTYPLGSSVPFLFSLAVFGLLIHFHFYIAKKLFTAPNFNLVNHEDLNRIL